MKKVECFMCEVCLTTYSEEDDAHTCEKYHSSLTTLEIESVSGFNKDEKYPNELIITNNDGSGCMYKLDHVGSIEDFYQDE